MAGRNPDPRDRSERIRRQLASGFDRPVAALRADALFLIKWADELREALAQMRNAAQHKAGCSKGIPYDGDPRVDERLMYAECECGMRQANDRAARIIHGQDFVMDRAPGKPPADPNPAECPVCDEVLRTEADGVDHARRHYEGTAHG